MTRKLWLLVVGWLSIQALGCGPSEQPAPGPALGVDTIKVGGIGVISGSHADYGRQMIMGATLAINEINEKGGILGSKIEMKFLDEQLLADVAVANAKSLVNEWGAHF